MLQSSCTNNHIIFISRVVCMLLQQVNSGSAQNFRPHVLIIVTSHNTSCFILSIPTMFVSIDIYSTTKTSKYIYITKAAVIVYCLDITSVTFAYHFWPFLNNKILRYSVSVYKKLLYWCRQHQEAFITLGKHWISLLLVCKKKNSI